MDSGQTTVPFFTALRKLNRPTQANSVNPPDARPLRLTAIVANTFSHMARPNRGTGAGGSKTTANGALFEGESSLWTHLQNHFGFSETRKGKAVFLQKSPVLYFEQTNLARYYGEAWELPLKHFYHKPDMAFVVENEPNAISELVVLEAKSQNGSGSVYEKLYAGPKREIAYKKMLGPVENYRFAYCLNPYLWEKVNNSDGPFQDLREEMAEKRISLFEAGSPNYFDNITAWLAGQGTPHLATALTRASTIYNNAAHSGVSVEDALATASSPEMPTRKAHPTPLLKWVGGKSKILDKIVEKVPDEVQNYREPFVGGGSVLLALLTEKMNGRVTVRGEIIASDINSELIRFYTSLQKEPRELFSEIESLMTQYESLAQNKEPPHAGDTKPKTRRQTQEAATRESANSQEEFYYWARRAYNTSAEELRKTDKTVGFCQVNAFQAALFYFLNHACFRGIYRENRQNQFNVPFGNYPRLSCPTFEMFESRARLLECVVFKHMSYQEALSDVREEDFVYLDPPYVPIKGDSFVQYVGESFIDHAAFFECCHDLRKRGVAFLMSNSAAPLVLSQFGPDCYEIAQFSCRRAVHSKNPASSADEMLVFNPARFEMGTRPGCHDTASQVGRGA